MASSEINDFLCGPLVSWFISCLEDPNALATYEDLIDGVLLHSVYLHVDSEPPNDGILPTGGNSKIRLKNLEIVVENIAQFYEKTLGNIVLVLPDVKKLALDSEHNVTEIKLLLLLLLGCAVQCSNKENFITGIKALNVDTQLAIVDCIKQITDYQDIVVSQEFMENLNLGGMFNGIKKLLKERHTYISKWRNLETVALKRWDDLFPGENISNCKNDDTSIVDFLLEAGETGTSELSKLAPKTRTSNNALTSRLEKLLYTCSLASEGNNSSEYSSREDSHRYIVELADWKSKVRKQRQELEEKTEALIECKEELEYNKALMIKLKEENQELLLEARKAKSYRDELDAAIEKAEKADHLEVEVARYREKLTDIEYYKSRIEELKEDNKVLIETREMLEEQLCASQKRAERVLELESEIIKYEKLLNDASLQRMADKDKYQELFEENTQLQKFIKTVASEVARDNTLVEGTSDGENAISSEGLSNSDDKLLSEQLSNNAQTRALKLELENRRLTNLVDSIKEKSFHESSSAVLELEKEKKKLSLRVDALHDTIERLTQQNNDLEFVCKQSLEENKKLQNSLSNQRTTMEKQQHDFQLLNSKFNNLERSYESTCKDRQRIQTLLESTEKRMEEMEKELSSRERELNDSKIELQIIKKEYDEQISDLKLRISNLEKEKELVQKEVQKIRGVIETKNVSIDEMTNTIEVLEKKIVQLSQENENLLAQISHLKEIEKSSRALDNQVAIDRQALENLQSNLAAEKFNSQQTNYILEKLGLEPETVFSVSSDSIFDKIAEISDVINRVLTRQKKEPKLEKKESTSQCKVLEEKEALEERLVTCQAMMETAQSEKNKLQANLEKMESQNFSLTSQQASLRLANSRLEADINELSEKYNSLQTSHQELTKDQKKLQSLHEQLGFEYEKLSREKESLKISLRDAKNECRVLRESSERWEAQCILLKNERDTLSAQTKSLSNLRGEHSKLKEDFRNLYTNTESLKIQYRNLQEDYRQSKLDNNRLNLKQTEMQGELSIRIDKCSNLELQISKLTQRCDMLLQMNTSLDKDRRSLMEHVSLLLRQYHELLTHSLEDKEHYHMEEKNYTDKVNNLHRQKEKLEEKIMEHYRKLDSCSNKTKKGLGASLVRRVRKAGSGLFAKNNRPRSWGIGSRSNDDPSLQSSISIHDDEADVDDVDIEDDDEDDPDDEYENSNTLIKINPLSHEPKIQDESNSSGCNDSDITDPRIDPAVNEDHVIDPLSLGHPGTRRTVYYSDSTKSPSLATKSKSTIGGVPPSTLEDQDDHSEASVESQAGPTQDEKTDRHSVLIYNKVSAVINDNSVSTATIAKDDVKVTDRSLSDENNSREVKNTNSVWYEYGCV